MFVGTTVLDKNDFVDGAIARKLGLDEIVTEAREQIHRAESKSPLGRGAPASRAAGGGGDYLRFSVLSFSSYRANLYQQICRTIISWSYLVSPGIWFVEAIYTQQF